MNKVTDRDMDGYFGWLLKYAGVNDKKNLEGTMFQLHSMDFDWSIENDSNRSADGVKLRKDFFGDDVESDILEVPCTILEFLIGLSKRVSEDLLGEDEPGSSDHSGVHKWLMLMLTNLGIIKDGHVVMSKSEICSAIEVWISRRFGENGAGSPFPLEVNNSGVDQTKVEIWRQLANYLNEHPDIFEGM